MWASSVWCRFSAGKIQKEVYAFVKSFGGPHCKPECSWPSQVGQCPCSCSQHCSLTFKYTVVQAWQAELRPLAYCFVCVAFFCQFEVDTWIFLNAPWLLLKMVVELRGLALHWGRDVSLPPIIYKKKLKMYFKNLSIWLKNFWKAKDNCDRVKMQVMELGEMPLTYAVKSLIDISLTDSPHDMMLFISFVKCMALSTCCQ